MSLPMLQVALDNQTLASAYETTRLIAEEVDIIEVGTILCVGEGVRAVRDLKALYPHKIVLADAKIADAGKILSRMCFEANADWVTVMRRYQHRQRGAGCRQRVQRRCANRADRLLDLGAGAGVARGGYSAGGLSPQPRRAGGRRGVE